MILDKGKDLVKLGTEKALTVGKDLMVTGKDLAISKEMELTQKVIDKAFEAIQKTIGEALDLAAAN